MRKRKILAAIIALTSVSNIFASLGIVGATEVGITEKNISIVDESFIANSQLAVTNKNVVLEGEEIETSSNISDMKPEYMLSSLYTIKKTTLTTWKNETTGLNYAMINVVVTEKETTRVVLDAKSIAITGYVGTALDVKLNSDPKIPDALKTQYSEEELKVKIIFDGAFKSTVIKTVDYTDTPIVYIGDNAFNSCKFLTEANLPSTLRYLGNYIYKDSVLKSVNINSILYNIPKGAFQNSKLENISMLDESKVKYIDEYAFSNTYLTQILNMSEDSDSFIGSNAYSGCRLLTNININQSLGISSFQNCESLETVNMIKGTYIDKSSFAGCTKLSEVKIPNELGAIGGGAFLNCINLKKIDLSKTKIGDWVAITSSTGWGFGDGIFAGCLVLSEVLLPPDLTIIPKNSFQGCIGLTNLSIISNPKIVQIDEAAFKGCTSATVVKFSPNLKTIGISAFENCTVLSEAVLPASCETIYDKAFAATAIKNVDLSYVKTIGKSVFSNCNSLVKAIINNAWDSIPESLFDTCKALETVTTSGSTKLSNIKLINKKGFYNCTALKNIDIPSVVILADDSFNGCTSLESISSSTNKMSSTIEDFGANCFLNCSKFNPIFESNIVSQIGASAFKGTGVQEVNITSTTGAIVILGNSAFQGTQVKKVNIEISKVTFGTAIFKDCLLLSDVYYNGNVIGNDTFSGCVSLNKISVPNANNIGSKAFYNCNTLAKLDLSKAEVIGTNAFEGCKNISEMIIGEKAQFNGIAHFKGCENITGDGFTFTINAIPSSMFAGCKSLKYLNDLSAAVRIDANAFDGCTSLYANEVKPLKLNAVNIGSYAFRNTGITYLGTGKDLTTVGISAFEGCTKLKIFERALIDKWTVISSNTFKNCTSLGQAVIPSYVTKIDSNAFYGCSYLSEVLMADSDTTVLTIGSNAFKDTGLTYLVAPSRISSIAVGAIGFTGSAVTEGFQMKVKAGTVAETYGKTYNIPLVYDGTVPVTLKYGDCNNDGSIDNLDIVAMCQHLIKVKDLTGDNLKRADLTGDDIFDVADVAVLKQYLMGDNVKLGK